MNYRVRVRRQAKTDLRNASRWYELQRPGLGSEFVAQVDAVMDRLAINPHQYALVHRDVRRAITRRFPYGVFYRLEGDGVLVFAINHLRRNPVVWRGRSR